MNNKWIQFIVYFIFMILIQGLVLNLMPWSVYFHPMIYIIVILMMPFDTNFFVMLLVSLLLGIGVDGITDSFGLHTSSALLIGYLRPNILKLIRPRDGYEDTLMPSVHDMGYTWFFTYASLTIAIHHIWFFTFEVLRFDLIDLIVLKTLVSSLASFGLILLFQYIFYKPSR